MFAKRWKAGNSGGLKTAAQSLGHLRDAEPDPERPAGSDQLMMGLGLGWSRRPDLNW